MKAHLLAAGALLALTCGLSRADVIVAPGFAYPAQWGGDWIGTFTGLPPQTSATGTQTLSVAQQFVAPGDFTDLALTVQLSDLDPAIVNFSLAADANGSPGAAIETESVTVEPTLAGVLTNYALEFPQVALMSGDVYWIVASSPTVEPSLNQVQLPIWAFSPCNDSLFDPGCNQPDDFPFAVLDSLDGPNWIPITDGESFAYELDGVDPVASPEPRIPIALGVCLVVFVGWNERKKLAAALGHGNGT
jgi:hypothetical protein